MRRPIHVVIFALWLLAVFCLGRLSAFLEVDVRLQHILAQFSTAKDPQ